MLPPSHAFTAWRIARGERNVEVRCAWRTRTIRRRRKRRRGHGRIARINVLRITFVTKPWLITGPDRQRRC